MKIVGIMALVLGMAFGSTAFARDHGDHHGEGTKGIGTECWMEQERGGTVEICGTIFPGSSDSSDHEPHNGR
jgi:hypothetical protein